MKNYLYNGCAVCFLPQCSQSILVKSLSYFILYFKACLHVKVKYTLALKPVSTSSCMKSILIFILQLRKWFNAYFAEQRYCWVFSASKMLNLRLRKNPFTIYHCMINLNFMPALIKGVWHFL